MVTEWGSGGMESLVDYRMGEWVKESEENMVKSQCCTSNQADDVYVN